jgi:hypothetical protein
MPSYNSTARVPFAHGGSVKKPKPKRIILWKGKLKDFKATKAAEELRNKKEHGGKIKETPKWTSRPGKRRKTAKKQRTSGRDRKINPQWLKEKYNVELKAEGGIISLNKGGKVRRKKETREKTKTKYRGSNIEKPEWGFKKGGKADNKWIQKATKGMRKDKPCTGKKFGSATCPPGSKRYNLAKTFKKMARSKHASGGLVRYI